MKTQDIRAAIKYGGQMTALGLTIFKACQRHGRDPQSLLSDAGIALIDKWVSQDLPRFDDDSMSSDDKDATLCKEGIEAERTVLSVMVNYDLPLKEQLKASGVEETSSLKSRKGRKNFHPSERGTIDQEILLVYNCVEVEPALKLKKKMHREGYRSVTHEELFALAAKYKSLGRAYDVMTLNTECSPSWAAFLCLGRYHAGRQLHWKYLRKFELWNNGVGEQYINKEDRVAFIQIEKENL